MRDWFVFWGRLLADTGRVLRDHWPQLVGLCLIGIIGRMGFLWLALWGSKFHGAVGMLILPLAPLSTLISLMLMLRVTSETLSAFRGTYRGSTFLERWYYHFMITARVLVPFIAAYAAQGMLAEDSRYYIQDIYYDDNTNSVVADSAARLDYAEGWYLLLLVGVTLVLRKTISITDIFRRSTVAALGAMYLESLWVVTLAKAFFAKLKEILQWIRERAVVDNLAKAWEAFSAWLGPVGDALRAAVEWAAGLGGGFSTLVVIPLAWLAIGAANYQADLASSENAHSQGRGHASGKALGAFTAGARRARRTGHHPAAQFLGCVVTDHRRRTRAHRDLLPVIRRGEPVTGRGRVVAARSDRTSLTHAPPGADSLPRRGVAARRFRAGNGPSGGCRESRGRREAARRCVARRAGRCRRRPEACPTRGCTGTPGDATTAVAPAGRRPWAGRR